MSEVRVPPATLASICDVLGVARTLLEESAGSAPATVDGGEMTPVLAAMLGKLIDCAATMSESLAAISTEVSESESDFWATDSAMSSAFGEGRSLDD